MFIEKRGNACTYRLTPEAFEGLDNFKKKYPISKDLIVALSIEMTCKNPEAFLEYFRQRNTEAIQKNGVKMPSNS
jgi:hypothetical protein